MTAPQTASQTVAEFEFVVPGKPTGKGRPRFGNGRAFTDGATVQAERDVLGCWVAAGEPRIDGPLVLVVTLVVERPKGHYRADGATLSAEGQRHPFPDNQKPDVDNALKLVMDALNTRAWHDDVAIVRATVAREWGRHAWTHVHVRTAAGW